MYLCLYILNFLFSKHHKEKVNQIDADIIRMLVGLYLMRLRYISTNSQSKAGKQYHIFL